MRALGGSPSAPYQLGQRNAGSSLKLEVTSLDDDDVLVTPSSMRYRIDNLTAAQTILGWTNIADPESVQLIRIPASLNAIVNIGDDFELVQVTVEITVVGEDDETDTQQQLFIYQLVNLSQGQLLQS